MLWMLLHRPYVFAFLAAFLLLATRRFGVRRSLMWLATGYLVALCSEALSIRTGIPYGWYFYRYDVLLRDPLVFGVPFWDSLSYPFLIYAGYSLAERKTGHAHSFTTAMLGAFCTMMLDVIIDPVAHLGSQWFLGNIYYYAHPGWYFDIPLSNFAGWFLVAFLVIRLNQWYWRQPVNVGARHLQPKQLDLWFYISIALFNIVISAWIGSWWLALCSSIILLGITLWSWQRTAHDQTT